MFFILIFEIWKNCFWAEQTITLINSFFLLGFGEICKFLFSCLYNDRFSAIFELCFPNWSIYLLLSSRFDFSMYSLCIKCLWIMLQLIRLYISRRMTWIFKRFKCIIEEGGLEFDVIALSARDLAELSSSPENWLFQLNKTVKPGRPYILRLDTFSVKF